MENISLRSTINSLQSEVTRLRVEVAKGWSRPGYTSDSTSSGQGYYSRPRAQRTRTTSYGIRQLTPSEREFLCRMAQRAKSYGDVSRSLHRVANNRMEHGLMSRLVKKGFTEKRREHRWHGITAKGIEYLKNYCNIS